MTRYDPIVDDTPALRRAAREPRFARRFAVAAAGVRTAWREDAGARNQLAGGVAMLVALAVVQPTAVWWAVAVLGSTTVVALELINTALERLIDCVDDRQREPIRKIKDIAAAAVITASLGVLAVGVLMILSTYGVLA